jgi:UDP-N-acetylmuramate dehydrogenase
MPLAISHAVPLAPLTTLGVGGPARHFARVEDLDTLRAALTWAAERGLPVLPVGGGSNLVVADAGWPGLALQIAMRGMAFAPDGDATRLTAGAGEVWDALVAAAVERGLAGLECLSGIPGWVGGTPIQNVGAYGQEVADTLHSVTVIERAGGAVHEFSAAECGFAYRMSRFKGVDAGRYLVVSVRFRLRSGAPTLRYPDLKAELAGRGISAPTLADARAAVLTVRASKGMVLDAADPDSVSVGSFFMNPVVSAAEHTALAAQGAPGHAAGADLVKVPAAWLIEHAGFAKGHVAGAVGLSTKHPLAIINRGGATAREVVALASAIKRAVDARFGIRLRAEPVLAGFGDDADVAHLQAP